MVELSETEGQRVLWADRFDISMDDLLELRFTIAAQIVGALELRIPMIEATRAATLSTANLDSWSAYHRGLWHMFRFNRHDNEIAATMFARALEADAPFARAHAGLSFTHWQNAFLNYSARAEAERDLARTHAEKSVELDPLDPFANLTMGRAMILQRDLGGARTWCERSVGLNPNSAMALYSRALNDAISGLGTDSEEGVSRAMSLSPVDPMYYAFLSTREISHIVRGDYEKAVEWAEQGAKAPNAHVLIRVFAAIANHLAGRDEGAKLWVSEFRRLHPDYKPAKFFDAFPFEDPETRAKIAASLERLNI